MASATASAGGGRPSPAAQRGAPSRLLPPTTVLPRRRRWLVRTLAFSAILSYGVFLVRSPRQLDRLLDAAFDAVAVAPRREEGGAADVRGGEDDDGARARGGYRRTPYHDRIRARKRGAAGEADDADDGGGRGATTRRNGTSPVRMSFELHDPKSVPLRNAFNLYVKCPLGKVTMGKRKVPTGEFRTGKLPPSLVRVDPPTLARVDGDENDNFPMRRGRVLDFTVTVTTDLKLLLIGDSVMVQLAQAFDEMLMEGGQHATAEQPGSRTVVWEAWRGHDGGTVVAPTRGGGASAMWRMTGLLSESRKGKPPANSAGGGWSDKEINSLLNYAYREERRNATTTIGGFDVVVFRVMHGWMKIHEITHDRLVEVVELSNKLFGATTVVLMTIPFTNNVKTEEVMKQVNEINDDMREIARGWHLRENTGVRDVLILEYGTYYDHIIWSSGMHLGYNVTHPLRATRRTFEEEGPGFVFDRLHDAGEWAPSIPMVCSDLASLGNDRRKCNRNYLFSDGMHTCPESLAGRYAAGLACLVGCAHNGREGNNTDEGDRMGMRECERECNEQFLSVVPVEESWVDTNTTLASFSG